VKDSVIPRHRHLLLTATQLRGRFTGARIPGTHRPKFRQICRYHYHRHHHHFICPIIQQYVHLHQYSLEEHDSKVRQEHSSCPKTCNKTVTGYIVYHTSKILQTRKPEKNLLFNAIPKTFKDVKFTVDGSAFQAFITLSTKKLLSNASCASIGLTVYTYVYWMVAVVRCFIFSRFCYRQRTSTRILVFARCQHYCIVSFSFLDIMRLTGPYSSLPQQNCVNACSYGVGGVAQW